MADGILYLDVDDEITSAATRIRRAEEERIALVLPYGSKVATSRINFRLLARDALTHDKRLSIVAPDGATRALAASAGLPVFASVAEYEESLGDDGSDGSSTASAAAAAPRGTAAAAAGATAAADSPRDLPEPAAEDASGGVEEDGPGVSDATVVMAVPAARRSAPPWSQEAPAGPATSIPVIGSSRPIVRAPLAIGAAIVALALVVVGVGAYALLPAATVVVTPHEQPVGPQTFAVVADTTAEEPDAEAGIVPADTIEVDVAAQATFEATGVRVERTRAQGRVTFQSLDTSRTNTIPKGSIVSTEGGVEFRTLESIRLPRAQVVPPLSINPSSGSVAIEAVRNGETGNVPVNAIVVVPPDEDPTITKVRNTDATSGGSRTEFPVVEQVDVDNAVTALEDQLRASLDEQLRDPAIAPTGTTVFPDTADLGTPTPTASLEELVGQELETFDLGLSSTATVVAVDPSPVESIARSRLESIVSPGFQLVDGSVSIEPGRPVVTGRTIRFPVTVEASQVRLPDEAELRRLILGKPADEARSLLAPYGDVDLSLWPDWVTNVPTIDARIDIEVQPPLPVDLVAPSDAPAGSAPP